MKINITYLLVLIMCTAVGASSNETTERPNILIALMDDASYIHMGAYGCKWVKTPVFDKVAREGVLFTNTYTPNAKCAPSRAAILTGRNPWQLEEAANHWCYFPKKFKTYAEVFTENGYHVGYTGKGWQPGVVGDINGKKRKLIGQRYDEHKTIPPAKSMSRIDYSTNFRSFLDADTLDKPFCFWYGSREPHRAYEYGSGIKKGGKKYSDIDSVFSFWPDNKVVRADMLDYAFEVEYFDQHLGEMIQILEERNELENTLIVVTSDNGMPFPRIKGQYYEHSNHMPFAVMWKNGIKYPGRTVHDYVSFIDIAPTFLEIAGINGEKQGMFPIEGKSIVNLLQSTRNGNIDKSRDHIIIGKERNDVGRPNDEGYPVRGIVKGEFLYVHIFEPSRWPACDSITGYLDCDKGPTLNWCVASKDNPETFKYWQLSLGLRNTHELYNIKLDPDCVDNLYEKPEYEKIAEDLKKQLFNKLKEQEDPRVLGNGHIFDAYEYANPRQKNYYNRYINGKAKRKRNFDINSFEIISD